MPIHAYMQMPTGVANITNCITQVTLKLVNYALLVNKLWFGLVCLELLGNFSTDKHGLDCCLQLDTKVFQLGLNNVSRSLKGMTTLVTFSAISVEACGDCWSATLELTKVLIVELIRC